jgi:hypothetical protein
MTRALLALALVAVTPGDATIRGSDTTLPEAGVSYQGQKTVTAGGTVDINTGGQGVRVKVDAAGITWSSNNLKGVAPTTESLVVTNAGEYTALWSVAIDGTNGKQYLFEVVTDTDNDPSAGATAHDQCHLDFEVQANTHMSSASPCIITVAAGEYVYLAVQEPGAGAGTDFAIDHGSLVLVQN